MTTKPSTTPLASDFPAAKFDQWRALVDKALKGADFDKRLVAKSSDGLRIDPLYTRKNALVSAEGGVPGAAPYTRGTKPVRDGLGLARLRGAMLVGCLAAWSAAVWPGLVPGDPLLPSAIGTLGLIIAGAGCAMVLVMPLRGASQRGAVWIGSTTLFIGSVVIWVQDVYFGVFYFRQGDVQASSALLVCSVGGLMLCSQLLRLRTSRLLIA